MNDNFNNGRIFCTKCGAPNKAGYRFCVRCGAKLMVLDPKPEPEISNELPQTEPVRSEPVAFEPEPAAYEPEPVAFEPEPAAYEPEPKTEKFETASRTCGVFEEPVPQEEPAAFEPEPITFEPEPEPEEAPQTFGVFEEPAPQEEPVKAVGFARHGEGAFEKEPDRPDNGFARSGFTGATTPTAAAGAFATAVDAVKNNKQIDVSDAETVMSLLEQGESSALAQGLPDWDIVPPQVVVRRKHRV